MKGGESHIRQVEQLCIGSFSMSFYKREVISTVENETKTTAEESKSKKLTDKPEVLPLLSPGGQQGVLDGGVIDKPDSPDKQPKPDTSEKKIETTDNKTEAPDKKIVDVNERPC